MPIFFFVVQRVRGGRKKGGKAEGAVVTGTPGKKGEGRRDKLWKPKPTVPYLPRQGEKGEKKGGKGAEYC